MDVFANGFGRIEPGRVTFNLKKGWFAGRLKTDYPTQHITSVSLETSRRPIWSAICGFLGLGALSGLSESADPAGQVIIGVLLIVLAIYFALGRPAIHFATAGGERIISYGSWPWEKNDAQQFVDAIRNEVFGGSNL